MWVGNGKPIDIHVRCQMAANSERVTSSSSCMYRYKGRKKILRPECAANGRAYKYHLPALSGNIALMKYSKLTLAAQEGEPQSVIKNLYALSSFWRSSLPLTFAFPRL